MCLKVVLESLTKIKKISEACNGEDAVNIVKENMASHNENDKYDVIFMDV